MITDEAVKAAARAIWKRERDTDQHDEPFKLSWYEDEARAALEAALPHLIASQGCGTGHSADAGTLPALASSLRNGLEAMACYATVPMNLWDRFSNNVLKAADALDGGEAVHSPAEREGSRDEPKTDEYEGCGKCVYCTNLGAHELCRGHDLAHPQKGGEG